MIGTEVTTWELLADAIALYFFEAFLAGVPAGEALLSAQRRLLAKHNPLGLAYSLYGSADLCLEKPKQAQRSLGVENIYRFCSGSSADDTLRQRFHFRIPLIAGSGHPGRAFTL